MAVFDWAQVLPNAGETPVALLSDNDPASRRVTSKLFEASIERLSALDLVELEGRCDRARY